MLHTGFKKQASRSNVIILCSKSCCWTSNHGPWIFYLIAAESLTHRRDWKLFQTLALLREQSRRKDRNLWLHLKLSRHSLGTLSWKALRTTSPPTTAIQVCSEKTLQYQFFIFHLTFWLVSLTFHPAHSKQTWHTPDLSSSSPTQRHAGSARQGLISVAHSQRPHLTQFVHTTGS